MIKNLLSGSLIIAAFFCCSALFAQENFKLQILHHSNAASRFFPFENGYGGAAQMLSEVNQLRFEAWQGNYPSILLSTGDQWLPSPALAANFALAEGETVFDARVIDAFNYDAICLGNHDFELGPAFLAQVLQGIRGNRSFPKFLGANLDFSSESTLEDQIGNRLVSSTILFRGTGKIGVIGVTTPDLERVTSPRKVQVSNQLVETVTAEVAALEAKGVNKIILLSHLDSQAADRALVAGLRGVDVVISSRDLLLTNDATSIIPGGQVAGSYPLTLQDADNRAVYWAATAGQYQYIGNLTLTFDAEGNVIEIDETSNPRPVIGSSNPRIETLLNPLEVFLDTLDTVVIGTTTVDLEGRTAALGSGETNFGNLAADALLWQAQILADSFCTTRPDIALLDSRIIQNNSILPTGSDLSLQTTFDCFPNGAINTIVEAVSTTQFKALLEDMLAEAPTPNRPFYQIAGCTVEYNPLVVASSVQSVILSDSTVIVADGVVVNGADTISLALSTPLGAADHPFGAATSTKLGVTVRRSFQNYVEQVLNGIISATQYPADTTQRIQAVIPEENTTIFDLIAASDQYDTLELALIISGLQDTLGGTTAFTLFAPTDAAFQKLPAGVLKEWLAAPMSELRTILLNHIIEGELLSLALTDSLAVQNLNAETLHISLQEGALFIESAEITMPDLIADNGVVHGIDALLLPETSSDTAATVVDYVIESDVHNTLAELLDLADLSATLRGEGPFSLFAPTDAAFELLPPNTLEALLADPAGSLRNTLLYHALNGAFTATELIEAEADLTLQIPTLLGEFVSIDISPAGVFINEAKVTQVDVITGNGVVQVIDAVLLPPPGLQSPEARSGAASITIAPNPVKDNLNLEYRLMQDANIQIELVDQAGKRIQQIHNGTQVEGDYIYNISTNGLPKGVHYLRLGIDGQSMTIPMVVQ